MTTLMTTSQPAGSRAQRAYSAPRVDGGDGFAGSAVPTSPRDVVQPARPAGVGQLVGEAHREHRVGERRHADADGGRARGEEVEHVVDRRHAADADDRDVDGLRDLEHDAQRDRPQRGPADAAVAARERRGRRDPAPARARAAC